MHYFQNLINWTEDVTGIAHNLILYTYCLTLKMEEEIGTCDEGGNRSSPGHEEPPGILQLIDQLENIVDTLLLG